MSETTASKGGKVPLKRVQAEVSNPRPVLIAEDGHSKKKGGAAEKRGWSLFNEDVRRGRFFSLIGLAFILAAAVSFATSPEYVVASVTVEGSKVLSLDQANEIAGVAGSNIFTIDQAAVQQRLAEKAALLKGVSVETRLPNSVIIHVLERRPAVVWVIGDGTPLLASDDHVVVGNAGTLDGFVTIFDRGPMSDSLKIGQPMPVNKADASDIAQQIYLTLPQATGLQLRQLEWAPDNGITAITATGQQIEFGTGDKLDRQIKIVQSVVQQAQQTGKQWSILDVRSVDRPSIKR
ncbi:MAG: FtsQ-type POTRA domain-containing protein [Chloroflexota bacterium]